ncbi:hypothetical protein HDU84_009044 [Entophlyctis sp. JEL0112]|nr:hypothetical protein HDU84_009044 [Entophlyctis sp. JEL0112]
MYHRLERVIVTDNVDMAHCETEEDLARGLSRLCCVSSACEWLRVSRGFKVRQTHKHAHKQQQRNAPMVSERGAKPNPPRASAVAPAAAAAAASPASEQGECVPSTRFKFIMRPPAPPPAARARTNTPKMLQRQTRKNTDVSPSRVPVPVRQQKNAAAAPAAAAAAAAAEAVSSEISVKARVSATAAPATSKPLSATSTYTKPKVSSRTDSGLHKTGLPANPPAKPTKSEKNPTGAPKARNTASTTSNAANTLVTIEEKNVPNRDGINSEGTRPKRGDEQKPITKKPAASQHATTTATILVKPRQPSHSLKAENEKLKKENSELKKKLKDLTSELQALKIEPSVTAIDDTAGVDTMIPLICERDDAHSAATIPEEVGADPEPRGESPLAPASIVEEKYEADFDEMDHAHAADGDAFSSANNTLHDSSDTAPTVANLDRVDSATSDSVVTGPESVDDGVAPQQGKTPGRGKRGKKGKGNLNFDAITLNGADDVTMESIGAAAQAAETEVRTTRSRKVKI